MSRYGRNKEKDQPGLVFFSLRLAVLASNWIRLEFDRNAVQVSFQHVCVGSHPIMLLKQALDFLGQGGHVRGVPFRRFQIDDEFRLLYPKVKCVLGNLPVYS